MLPIIFPAGFRVRIRTEMNPPDDGAEGAPNAHPENNKFNNWGASRITEPLEVVAEARPMLKRR